MSDRPVAGLCVHVKIRCLLSAVFFGKGFAVVGEGVGVSAERALCADRLLASHVVCITAERTT